MPFARNPLVLSLIMLSVCAACADPGVGPDDDDVLAAPQFTGAVQVSEIFMHAMGSWGSSAAAGFAEPGEGSGPEILASAGRCTVYEAGAMSMGAPSGGLDAGDVTIEGGSTDVELLFTGNGYDADGDGGGDLFAEGDALRISATGGRKPARLQRGGSLLSAAAVERPEPVVGHPQRELGALGRSKAERVERPLAEGRALDRGGHARCVHLPVGSRKRAELDPRGELRAVRGEEGREVDRALDDTRPASALIRATVGRRAAWRLLEGVGSGGILGRWSRRRGLRLARDHGRCLLRCSRRGARWDGRATSNLGPGGRPRIAGE